MMLGWLTLAALALPLAAASLDAVKAEPDPNKRAVLALSNAEASLNEARNASHAGDWKKMAAAFEETSASADLCYQSLQDSGKPPRKNNRYKQAELKLRSLIRMLAGFSDDIPFDERGPADASRAHLQDVHDRILDDEMEKR